MDNLVKSRHRQKGMSAPGWLAVVAFFGLLVITFFKVFPMYYQNFQLQSSLDSLKGDTDVDPKSKREIWDSLRKRLYVNDVKSIRRENIKITRKNGKTTITVSYENRNDWVGNLYIGAHFVETVVIDR